MALLPLRVRVRAVEPADYAQPIGYLAGVKGIGPVEVDTAKDSKSQESQGWEEGCGEDAAGKEQAKLPAEFLVMAGLSGVRVDQVLSAIRKSGVGPIPYKAVLTATNQEWDAYGLVAELMREHEQMSQK